MWNRQLLLSAIVASTFVAVAPAAEARVDVFISVPPPPMRHEVVPAPRVGYVWAPGYWNWHSNRHVWAKGHWERERVGYYYHPHRWSQQQGWSHQPGRWDRNAPMGDRDGDGVRNYEDRRPDDARRY